VVRSQTHFVPEAAKAGDGIAGQIATASSAQDQAAAGQVGFPFSRKQHDSELSTTTASPRNDVAKGEAPALAPNQTDPSQTVAFATEQRSNMTADGSSFADAQAENPTNAVAASRLTPNGGGGNSHDGSAKDKDSHNNPADGPSASTEVPRSSEVSLAIPIGASGSSPSTPAQQILDGIQHAIPAADTSEAPTSALQPTLDGQQPLKTITVALSPASLGTVAVELSLKSGQLGVKLRVQEAGTAQLLRQDGALEKLLESAGYAVQSLSIHLSPQPSQPPQTPGQATPNGQGFSNPFSSSGSGQEQGRSQSHKDQPTDRNGDQRPGHGRTENVSGGGSLYV
jgi:flagellar hook-length control protein FliK